MFTKNANDSHFAINQRIGCQLGFVGNCRNKGMFGERMICKDEKGVNKEVQAACFFAKQFDVDAEYEFWKIHRKRVPPRRLDETSETVATV